MVLIEPPSLLESVTEQKYHYPHTFHCRSEKLFRILKLHIYRSSDWSRSVWLLRLPRFYTSRVINVPVKLLFNSSFYDSPLCPFEVSANFIAHFNFHDFFRYRVINTYRVLLHFFTSVRFKIKQRFMDTSLLSKAICT